LDWVIGDYKADLYMSNIITDLFKRSNDGKADTYSKIVDNLRNNVEEDIRQGKLRKGCNNNFWKWLKLAADKGDVDKMKYHLDTIFKELQRKNNTMPQPTPPKPSAKPAAMTVVGGLSAPALGKNNP